MHSERTQLGILSNSMKPRFNHEKKSVQIPNEGTLLRLVLRCFPKASGAHK